MADEQLFSALRTAASWDEVGASVGLTPAEARSACADLLRRLAPAPRRETAVPDSSAVIVRDDLGIPTITAGNAPDAWLGLGFAMAEDRLFQLDYLRRAAGGRLAEVMGPAGAEGDRVSRVLDLAGTARRCAAAQEAGTAAAVEAFAAGVNLARAAAVAGGLPFEFRLLEYSPEPWTAIDTHLVLRAFWWQLTGRFPILCVPEFLKRHLPAELYRRFLLPEGEELTIWPPGLPFPGAGRGSGSGRVGDEAAPGSNNWVVSGTRTVSGAPLLCSDPHVPFALPSVWYEAALHCPQFSACGAGYAGVPGFFFGRSGRLAWGLTNNISSLRDLYLEVTDDFDPNRYVRVDAGGHRHWRGMTSRTERIQVRGAPSIEIEVREVDHGPVVTDILPEFMPRDETVSLRWVGHGATREQEALLGLAMAGSVREAREVLRGWSCPTFNFVLADSSGEIGYQLTGAIPLRQAEERGYRPGDDPAHAWAGAVPYEGLPAFSNPPQGWLGSCNNRVVDAAWPHALSGTWPSDVRMRRLAAVLNTPGSFDAPAMARLQGDNVSVRAIEWRLPAARALESAGVSDPLVAEWVAWDGAFEPESRAALTFEAFFLHWSREALLARLPENLLGVVFPVSAGLTEPLLLEDPAGWFASPEARRTALRAAWDGAARLLERELGPDRSAWSWGRLHTLTLRHPAATTAPLRDLLNRGPFALGGGWNTLNNSLFEFGRPFAVQNGVSYRLLVDMAGDCLAVTPGGQSGHPGSPHYDDQFELWRQGRYHTLAHAPPD